MTDKRTTRLMAQAAVIAAIYVVLTIVFAPIAFEQEVFCIVVQQEEPCRKAGLFLPEKSF